MYTCKQYAIWLLSKREYATKDLKKKLLKKYTEEDTATTIEFLLEHNFLNDDRYSTIRTRARAASKSDKALSFDLHQKGVAAETIKAAVETLPLEENRLRDLIKKVPEDKVEKEKLIKKLLRKGFSYSNIKKVIAGVDACNYEEDY